MHRGRACRNKEPRSVELEKEGGGGWREKHLSHDFPNKQVFWTVEWEHVWCTVYLLHKVCSDVGEVVVSDDGRVGLGAKQLLVHTDKEGGRPT